MIGWIVAAWLAGALLLVMADAGSRWHADEVAALALWPLSVPVAWTVRRWVRWRGTCRICWNYYGRRRDALLRHVETHAVAAASADTPED